MTQEILETIFSLFATWVKDMPVACMKGCSTCCTINVSISWLEGVRIHRFIKANCMEEWLACKLGRTSPVSQPQMTANTFAAALLAGKDIPLQPMEFTGACPFLEDNLCCIYEVRPFGCVGFASQTPCSPGQPARVPASYMTATTAINQILEHLSRDRPWGNMISILLLLAENPAFRQVSEILNTPEKINGHRNACHIAAPLPGFLIGNTEQAEVFPLLEKIYTAEIGGRKLEGILDARIT